VAGVPAPNHFLDEVPTMNTDPQLPDVSLEVYLDGKFIKTIALDPATFAQALPEEGARAIDGPVPDKPRRSTVVELPCSGKLRLELHLRRQNPADSDALARPLSVTYCYGTTIFRDPLGTRTTHVYSYDATPPSKEPPTPPPDDPHVIE
jgi:hypothetical protein